MATKRNLTKQTCVCHYLPFAGPVYASIFANNSVTNNAISNLFAAFYFKCIILLPYKKALKSNKICDCGNEMKLNKTNMRLPLFFICGPVYANIFANNTLTNNAKTNQFAALYLRRIFLLPYKKVLKLNKICDLGNKKKLNKTNMCLPLFIFFVPYSQKISHNSATNNANQICFLHLSESLTIITFELE